MTTEAESDNTSEASGEEHSSEAALEVATDANPAATASGSSDDAITTEVEMEELGHVPSISSGSDGWVRFFLQSLVGLLIPVTAGVAVSWWLVRDLPDEQVLDRGGTMLGSTVAARNVSNVLGNRIDLLRTLSSQGTVATEVAAKNARYSGTPEVVDSIIRGVDEQWRAAFAAGEAPPRPVPDNAGSDALRAFRSLFPGYTSLLATDREGAATSSTEVTPQFDYSEESWFQNVMSSGQIELSTFFDSATQPFLSAAVPLMDINSRPSGVVRALIDPHSVVSGAVDDLETEDFRVIVVGREGELLFRSNTDSGDAPIDAALLELAQGDGTDATARRVELGDGQVVFASTATIPVLPNVDVGAGLGWRVVVVRDAETLAGLVAEQERRRADLLFVVSLVAAGLALILAWWLSRPFRRLRQVRRIVEQEAWDQRLRANGGVPKALAFGVNELLERAEISEDRHRAAVNVVRDAETLAQQTERFSGGDRLTAFQARGKELAPLAASLEALRDDLSRQLAEIDEAVRRASDLDKRCRQELDWVDSHETDARRSRKLKTEAKSLAVELSRLANQGEQELEKAGEELLGFRDHKGSIHERLSRRLTEMTDARETAVAAAGRSNAQLEDVDRAVKRISELSDRTGVLALNGSIQAALAGDAGRGFSVIASEVEQLSRQAIDLAHGVAKILSSAIREQSAAHDRLSDVGETMEQVRLLIESESERAEQHSGRIEASTQRVQSELKRARQSGQSAQTMALDLEKQEAAIASWQESAHTALSERKKVAQVLDELLDLMTKLHGRRGSLEVEESTDTLADTAPTPLSLVEPPADFDEEVDGAAPRLLKRGGEEA